ncbi:MAG TPA: chemotaxis protein CheB, partial [Thermoanaerobaculia bacterium]
MRIAVVDDSSFLRKAIARMLEDQTGILLVGLAARGEELLENLDVWRPDAVILDLSMPGIGGLATRDAIMATRPMPGVILSTPSRRGAPQTIEALHRGAVDFLDKQEFSLVDFDALRQALVGKIREITAPHGAIPELSAAKPERWPAVALGEQAPEVVLVGASTGGPPAIERLLTDLGSDLPLPVLIVQHMPAGFTRAFAERLNARLPLLVKEAIDGEPLAPSTVYIAPGGFHLRLALTESRLLTALAVEPGDRLHRPSVDVLFASAAEAGVRAVAVLLTGMGKDGCEGITQLSRRGALTIAQD